ncbi:hypothetical protein BH10PSE2_BH10PSE2_10000 [soil metagenome]
MIRQQLAPYIIAGFAAVTGLAAATAAASLIWPGSALAQASGLSWVYESRAAALSSAPEPSLSERAAAQLETRASLRSDPANATAWLRLAYLDSLNEGGLGPVGADALQRSYTVAPYGPDNTRWRLIFAFDHWQAIGAATRAKALEELNVALAAHVDFDDMPDSVGDPAGRMAATLMIGPTKARRIQDRRARWRAVNAQPTGEGVTSEPRSTK